MPHQRRNSSPLTRIHKRQKAVINPQNRDNECFKWAVIAALHNSEIKSKPNIIYNLRKFESRYDWSDLSFPTPLKEIGKFEFRNSISVNVLGLEGKDIYICRKGTRGDNYKEVNLLLVLEDDSPCWACKWNWHYTFVKSLSRLLASHNSKHKSQQHFCMNCLQGFNQEKIRDEYYSYCSDNESVRVEMSTKPILRLTDLQGQLKAPFVIYVDFESILEPMDTCSNDPNIPYMNHINKHTPSGFCTYSTFAYGDVDNPLKLYRGQDCLEEFCKHMRAEAHRLYNLFPEKPMDPLTDSQWIKYNKLNECHICPKPITHRDPKVRDHCHYTGLFRGPAHRSCNLRYKVPSYIPVVFHNLSGYDAHLFINELAKYSIKDMNVIAKNKENYVSFSVHVPVQDYTDKDGNNRVKLIELRFIDSYKFMASSLDSLTNNLVRGGHKLFGMNDSECDP